VRRSKSPLHRREITASHARSQQWSRPECDPTADGEGVGGGGPKVSYLNLVPSDGRMALGEGRVRKAADRPHPPNWRPRIGSLRTSPTALRAICAALRGLDGLSQSRSRITRPNLGGGTQERQAGRETGRSNETGNRQPSGAGSRRPFAALSRVARANRAEARSICPLSRRTSWRNCRESNSAEGGKVIIEQGTGR